MSDLLSNVDWDVINELLKSPEYQEFPTTNVTKMTTKPNGGGACPTSRFVMYEPEQAQQFINEQDNEATKKKTHSDMNQFWEFLKCQKEERPIETLPAEELDRFFGNFLLGARKARDQSEYEPSSLRGFMSSLDRHLKKHGHTYRVLNNPQFPHSNASLIAKLKDLKAKGFGNKPNESHELTDEDIDILFKEGILGLDSPTSVINMLHLNFSLVLGMRGGKEQKQLKWGDIEVACDHDGDEYLVHAKERSTKTRTGMDTKDVRKFKPKAWNCEIPERCPVRAYRLYASKRPEKVCNPDSDFFLAINVKNPTQGQSWYKASAMGINTIYGLTKTMITQCKGINDGRHLTNHSVRKHLVQKCCDLNLAPTETVQISGHKNIQSVNNYSKMNDQKQKVVARALGSNTCSLSDAVMPMEASGSTSLGQQTRPISRNSFMNAGIGQASASYTYSQQAMSSYFGSTTINGGTFIFHAVSGGDNCASEIEPSKKRFKRIRCLSSDSDSD